MVNDAGAGRPRAVVLRAARAPPHRRGHRGGGRRQCGAGGPGAVQRVRPGGRGWMEDVGVEKINMITKITKDINHEYEILNT